MSETQEPTVLTQEQQVRTHAVMTAAEVLRGRRGGSGPLTVGGTEPGSWAEIVEISDYIVTGYTYTANLRREEREENPLQGLIIGGGPLGSLLDTILGAETPEGHTGPGNEVDTPGVRIICDLLNLVEDEFPREMPDHFEISGWSAETKQEVQNWATAIHLVASDNNGIKTPPLPKVLDTEVKDAGKGDEPGPHGDADVRGPQPGVPDFPDFD